MPRAVPEIPTPPGGPDPVFGRGVSDDERHRYGVLLDHAMARGLLDEADYRIRLGELAEATSLEEMQRLVTELPAFAGAGESGAAPARRLTPLATGTSSSVAPGEAWNPLAAVATPARRRARTNPWATLVLVVLVVIAAFVLLTIYATHVVQTRQHGGLAPASPAAVAVSLPGP